MSDVEASSDIDTAGNDKIDGKHYIPKKLLRRDPKLQAQVRIEKLFEKGEQGKEIILPNPPKTLLEKQMKMMKPPPEHVRNIQGLFDCLLDGVETGRLEAGLIVF